MKATLTKVFAPLNPCIVNTPLVVKVNSDIHVYIGQGEGDTRWKGWAWKLLLVKFVTYLIIKFIFFVIPIRQYHVI